MKDLEAYVIKFVGLKQGQHQFEYQITNEFFEFFEYDDFNKAEVNVDVWLTKKPNMLEFKFDTIGVINLNCDVSTEAYDQPIENSFELVVKFGEEFNDDKEDLIILPWSEYELNVAQYIYETIVLSIPFKRIHPRVEDGTLDSEILDKLEELQPKADDQDKDEKTDPRWDDLKKLLND